MTVVPVNVEALKKQAEVESKARWKTEKGLIYPGFRTMQESNIHPKKPGTPRRDSLREVNNYHNSSHLFLILRISSLIMQNLFRLVCVLNALQLILYLAFYLSLFFLFSFKPQ